ncbi:MAG: FTR1 family protein [Aequorivita sp.]
MPRASHFLILLSFLLPFLCVPKIYAQEDRTIAETVVHLLSYVSMDYPMAVQNGEIIDQHEYEEQQEFSAEAYKLTKETSFLPNSQKEQLLMQLQELIEKVETKRPDTEISKLANGINKKIIDLTGIQTAPKIWPSLSNGKRLYAQTCASCHGATGKGDGAAGIHLNPPPSNFQDDDLMNNFSAYQAYNSIRFGVSGTEMIAYSNYNEAELWALAFYVKSLRDQDHLADSIKLRAEFQKTMPKIGLQNLARLTDRELLDTISHLSEGDAELKLMALRLLEPTGENVGNSLPTAKEGLRNALESYRAGNQKMARTLAISAYLEGIEPVEVRLRSIDAAFVVELETQMFKVRQAIEMDKGVAAIAVEIEKANTLIDQADEMLGSEQLNFWLTFLLAASIVLREGLEAFLILGVVIALIRAANAKRAMPWVHGGWISALLFGFAGWFLSDYIIQFGGKNREIMEGLVSLLAVVILLYAGFWLHNKSAAGKWTAFVEDKIGMYLQKEQMWGLAVFSFMIVFREAFEVILFLQAIKLEAGPQNKSAIGFGTLAAFIAIGILMRIFLKYTKNIPVRQIFKYSSYFIILLSVILMGKGFHSLQESGWVSVTPLPSMLRVEWLGIYPTAQTILAQLVLIVVIASTYFLRGRKTRDSGN